MKLANRKPTLPQVRCRYDYDAENEHYSCYRRSLPGRALCHKHAGMAARVARDRARKGYS